MKTVREWLECLPEPYRGQALANAEKSNMLDGRHESLYDALSSAFYWEGSPQGHDYWSEYSSTVYVGEAVSVSEPPCAPINALSAIHAIALKKGFPVEEIMSIQADEDIPDMWYYTLKGNSKTHNISLSND